MTCVVLVLQVVNEYCNWHWKCLLEVINSDEGRGVSILRKSPSSHFYQLIFEKCAHMVWFFKIWRLCLFCYLLEFERLAGKDPKGEARLLTGLESCWKYKVTSLLQLTAVANLHPHNQITVEDKIKTYCYNARSKSNLC